jgi:outer membrane protein OmpA-like peptidoglycan-associated protein
MSVKAKCLNYTGCLLAYRGEVLDLPSKAPLVCPECGKTVTVVQAKGGGVGKVILILLAIAAMGVVLYFLVPKLGGFMSRKPAPPDDSSEVVTPAPPTTTGGEPTPRGTSAPPEVKPSPAAPPSAPAKIDLNIEKPENQNVRDEVLKRIDVMPKISQANKDKLYNSVQRAKKMGLIMTIPFASGAARLPASEIPALKAQLEKPDILELRRQSTYVFVVLGFADPKGDEAKNLQISQSRADSVLEAMRDKCGVDSLMHAVAMGGSKLLDAQNLEKNRVVEVWAVLP